MSYSGSWSDLVQLGGNSTSSLKAMAGLDRLWLFSFIIVAIAAAVTSSKRHPDRPPTARLNKFWVTITIAIINYIFIFAYDILAERGAEVTISYLLAHMFFQQGSYFLVVICMLITIYSLLFRMLRRPDSSPSTARKRVLWAHYGFCAIVLGPLWLAFLGVSGKDLHDEYLTPDSPLTYKGIPIPNIIRTAFDALYVCASLEIVAGAIITFTVHPRSGILLLTLVACPLILHSVAVLAFNIVFVTPDGLQNANFAALDISASFLLGLFWLIVFVGIVIVSFQPSVPSNPTPFNMENMHEPARGQLLPTDSQPALIRDHSDEESPLDGVIYSDRGRSSWAGKMHWPSWRIKRDDGIRTS